MEATETDAETDAKPDAATARTALAWALAVSENPSRLETRPSVPTDADWEALAGAEVRETVDQLIVTRNVEEALEALQRVGFFRVFVPQIEEMVGMTDGEWRHKDVWKHTKQVVKQSVPRLEVRWGALLHDIGKPATRAIDKKGRVTFHGHAELGAKMFRRKVAKKLAFEGKLKDRVHFLILYHLRPAQYEAGWTDAAVRRFYKQMGEGLKDLLDLGRADITTKRPEKRRRGVRNISNLAQRIKALRTEDDKPKALPKGLGELIIERFRVPPSKRLGDLMKALEATVESGELPRGGEFELYLEHLEEHRERYALDPAD